MGGELDRSNFISEEQLADFAEDPELARRQLMSWEYVLGHFRSYFDTPNLKVIVVETWIHASERGADEAFLDGGLQGFEPEFTYEPATGFAK